MNKKLLLCLCIIFCTIITSASALTASLGNSRMILRANVTPENSAILNGSIIVNNVNEKQISIKIEPDDVLKYNLSIEIAPKTFILEKNESKELPFVLKVLAPGSYEGKIFVTYSVNNTVNGTVKTENAGMIANIIVIAKGPEGIYPEAPTPPPTATPTANSTAKPTATPKATPTSTATQPNTTVQPTTTPETNQDNGKPSSLIGAIIILAIVSIGLIIYFLFEKKR